jgi:hypothetical protein
MRVSIFGLILAVVMANARVLDLPWGPTKRLPSPDGTLALYEKASDNAPQLWIEDTRTHRRTKLFDIPSTLSAAWSADGSAFYVNDHEGSDEEQAYIYDAATLKRVDIGARIQAEDAKSRPFTKGHAYFHVERWEGNQEVTVRFFGHTDEPPVTDFDFRYRVGRTGTVKKLSQRTAPVKD